MTPVSSISGFRAEYQSLLSQRILFVPVYFPQQEDCNPVVHT